MIKEGIGDLIRGIILLGFFAFIGIFGFLFILNVITQDVSPLLINESLAINEQFGNDSTIANLISDQQTNMEDYRIQLDLLFLMTWIVVDVFVLIVAFLIPPIPKFNFISFLFIGAIFFLLANNFIGQIFTWLAQEFIIGVFDPSQTNLPIFNYYVDNYIFIAFLTTIAILVVNQFSFKQEKSFESFIEEADFEEREVGATLEE